MKVGDFVINSHIRGSQPTEVLWVSSDRRHFVIEEGGIPYLLNQNFYTLFPKKYGKFQIGDGPVVWHSFFEHCKVGDMFLDRRKNVLTLLEIQEKPPISQSTGAEFTSVQSLNARQIFYKGS